MSVYLASNLVATLAHAGISKDQFVRQFEWWKADVSRVNQSMFFGRDTPYAEPQIQGRGMVLRHAHMIPLKDKAAHEKWLAVFKRRGEKKSDKCVVYAQNDSGDFLLIQIFDEPGAHVQARREPALMRHLSRLAIQFIDGDYSHCEVAA